MIGRWLPIASLIAGVSLIAYSVTSGGAELSLFIVIPVVTGGSLAFVGGVVLLVLGMLTLPLAFEGTVGSSRDAEGPSGGGEGSGGVILLGPFPILFGSAQKLSRRNYWLLVFLGGALVAVTLGLFFFL